MIVRCLASVFITPQRLHAATFEAAGLAVRQGRPVPPPAFELVLWPPCNAVLSKVSDNGVGSSALPAMIGSEEVWEHAILVGDASGGSAALTPALNHGVRGAAHALGAPATILAWLDALDEALEASSGSSAALPSYLAFATRAEASRRLSSAAAELAHRGAGPDTALVVGWPTRAVLASLAAPASLYSPFGEAGLAHSLLADLPEDQPLWAALRGSGGNDGNGGDETNLDEAFRGIEQLHLRVAWEHGSAAAVISQVRLEVAPAQPAQSAVAAAAVTAASTQAASPLALLPAGAWLMGRARAWGGALRQLATSATVDVRALRVMSWSLGDRLLVPGADDVTPASVAKTSAAEAAADAGGVVRLWFSGYNHASALGGTTPPESSSPDSPAGAVARRLANPETDPYWRAICATSSKMTGYTSTKPAGCSSWYSDTSTFWCGISGNNCNYCNPASVDAGYYYFEVFLSYCACAAGTYSAAGAIECTTCPAGTYSAAISTSCTTCTAGRYAAEGSSSCSVCAAGTEAAAGASTCSDCSAGKYSLGGASGTPTCTSCPAGQYQTYAAVSFCISCPAGYYCPLGSAAYATNPCSAGRYSAAGASSCVACASGTYNPTAGSSNCAACGAGSYSAAASASTACVACSAGFYQNTGGQSSCVSCSTGQYSSSSGAVACSDCAMGTYQSLAGKVSCTSCPAGSYSSAKASACTACSAGYYASSSGKSACTACSAGKYSVSSGGTSCLSCAAGTYASGVGSTVCSACVLGTYTATTGTANCASCPSGQYGTSSSSTACSPCVAGQYQGTVGQTSCVNCAAGRYSDPVASSCPACAQGQYSAAAATSCTTCSSGKYTSTTGQSSCSSCSVGRYSSEVSDGSM